MNDTELFDLCKKVYEATGWRDVEYLYFNSVGGWVLEHHGSVDEVNKTLEEEPNDWIPLYTSDYLADKLRQYDWNITNLNSKNLSLQSDSLDDPDGAILGSTLTIVLLEFVLALVEQGEKL